MKYKKIEYENDDKYDDDRIVTEHYLVFFENGVEKKSFMINSSYWRAQYYKEISIFKNKYLVCVTETNTGDTLQFVKIFDEGLNFVDLGEASYLGYGYSVNNRYENYYSIDDNSITYIDTVLDFEKDLPVKVTSKIMEKDNKLYIQEIERTTEGVVGHAGRT